MTVEMGNPKYMEDEDPIIQEAFDIFMEDYELDLEMSFEDILYEMFAAGFETALELLDEDDD